MNRSALRIITGLAAIVFGVVSAFGIFKGRSPFDSYERTALIIFIYYLASLFGIILLALGSKNKNKALKIAAFVLIAGPVIVLVIIQPGAMESGLILLLSPVLFVLSGVMIWRGVIFFHFVMGAAFLILALYQIVNWAGGAEEAISLSPVVNGGAVVLLLVLGVLNFMALRSKPAK